MKLNAFPLFYRKKTADTKNIFFRFVKKKCLRLDFVYCCPSLACFCHRRYNSYNRLFSSIELKIHQLSCLSYYTLHRTKQDQGTDCGTVINLTLASQKSNN